MTEKAFALPLFKFFQGEEHYITVTFNWVLKSL